MLTDSRLSSGVARRRLLPNDSLLPRYGPRLPRRKPPITRNEPTP